MSDKPKTPGTPGTKALYREKFFASQDDLKLYYRDYGDALSELTPVICLPGLTRNSKDFHPIASLLSSAEEGGRRVLCADLRGRGLSQRDSNYTNYAVPTYLGDIQHMAAVAGVERAIFIGTSLGGMISTAMAAARPSLVAGVVLNDIGPELDPRGLARIASYVGKQEALPDWEAAIAAMQVMYKVAYPDFDDAEWLDIAQKTFREDDQGRPAPDYDPDIGTALREATENQAPEDRPDLWALFGALRDIPLLGLRGELSDILASETFARMQQENPDMAAIEVPNRGHVPKLDEPVCQQAILEFVRRVDSKS